MQQNNEQLLAELHEPRFAAIFRSSPIGICITTLQEGTFLDANPAFLKTENLNLEEILGRTSLELGYWLDPLERRNVVQRLVETGPIINYEMSHRLRDGRINHSLRSLERITLDGRDCIVTMLTDITDRRQAEQLLRESEERYRTLVDQAPIGIFVNVDDQFAYMNDAFCRLVGATSKDQLLGQSVFERFHPDFHDVIRQRIHQVKEQQQSVFAMEQRYVRLDGTVVPVETLAIPIHFQGQSAAQVVVNDISERLRAEETRRTSEQRFRALIEHSFDAIALLGRDGTFLYGSPAAARITGRTADVWMGQSAFENMHPDDLPLAKGLFAKLLSDPERPRQAQLRYRHKDDSWIWLDVTATNLLAEPAIQAIVVNYRDITERRKAEDESQSFGRVLDESFNEIYMFDAESLHFVRVNFGAQRNLGYTMEELRQLTPLDLTPEFHRASFEALLKPLRTGQQLRHVFETVHLRKEGTTYPVEVHVQLMNGPESPVFVAIIQDITGHRRAERDLRDSNERFQLVAKATNDAVWDWDLQNDVGWWNDGIYALFGYTREQKPAESIVWKEHLHTEDRDRVLQGIQAVIPGGGQTWFDEYRIIRADGSIGFVFDRGFVLRDATGKAYRMIGAAQDITDRKRAEQALRDNEARLMGLINSAMDAIITFDEDRNVVLFNPAAERIFQWPCSEVIGQSINRFLPEPFHAAHDEHVREFAKSGTTARQMGERRRVTGRRRDGSDFPAEASIMRVSVTGQQFFTVILRDITDRQRAEDALRESEGRLRLLVKASDIGLWDWNLLTNEAFLSPEWKWQLGYADHEVANHYLEWESRLHPEDHDRALAAVNDFREGRRTDYDIEFRLRHKDGSWRWIMTRADLIHDSDDRPIRMMGCHVDITARKQAEESLVEHRRQLAALLRHLPGMVYRCANDEKWTMTFVSEGAEQLTGFRADELLHSRVTSFGELVSLDDREWLWANCQRSLAAHVPCSNEYRIRHRDGSIRWVWDRASGHYDENGALQYVEGYVADVTERRRAEEELRRSERLFATVFRNSPVALGLTSLLDGRILDCNEAYCQLLGYQREELIGRSTLELNMVDPNERTRHLEVLKKQRRLLGQETRYRTKSGAFRDVLISAERLDLGGEPLILGISQDITERKQVELALRESQAMLELVLDSIPQGVFWKDRDSVYRGANRVSRRAMGFEAPQGVVGRTDFDVPNFQKEQAESFVQKDREIMQSDQAQLGIVETMTLPEGATIWLETNKLPMHDAAGNVTGILGTWEDITERKRANEELAASRERLEALSRQLLGAQEAERRHLSRELHDEIGQALTGIKLNLKTMQQRTQEAALGPLVQETINVVEQTLHQVRNLALDLRPSMLDELGLEAALRWCFNRQAQRAGFAPQFFAESLDCAVSKEIETTCFRVAQESLTNIACHANARHVRLELRQHGAVLELLVQDDGVGFDVAAARDRAAAGASLGLLGMQERVQLSGGQLEIESITAGGTLVRARFPIQNTLIVND